MKRIVFIAALVAMAGSGPLAQDSGEAGRNWVTHQGDQGGTQIWKYAPAPNAPATRGPVYWAGTDFNGGSFFGSPTSDEVIAYALP